MGVRSASTERTTRRMRASGATAIPPIGRRGRPAASPEAQTRALAADAAIHEVSAHRGVAVSVHGHMVVGHQQQVGARSVRVELLSHVLGYQPISMDEEYENGA